MRCTAPAMAALMVWMTIFGFAPAHATPKLVYSAIDLDRVYGQHLASTSTAMPPAVSPRAALPATQSAPRPLVDAIRRDGQAWNLSVNAGITADSNVTNATDDRFLWFRQGDATIPIELTPAFRAQSGIGRGASMTGSARFRLSDDAAIVVGAEGYAQDYKGSRNDDVSFTAAAGPEIKWSGGQSASLQVTAGDSWYGGTSTSRGIGLRARYSARVAEGRTVSVFADARSFKSGYGRAFGGEQANAYLGGSAVLNPVTTASVGVFARREWLGAREYSNVELGLYGGVSRYLGSMLTGSLTAGFSRTAYDAPLLYLSDRKREDLRFNAGVSLTTREPIGMGVYPTIGYSYNRTDGSVDFFDADRHRMRVGVRRTF